jgi:hypothetical protein
MVSSTVWRCAGLPLVHADSSTAASVSSTSGASVLDMVILLPVRVAVLDGDAGRGDDEAGQVGAITSGPFHVVRV